MATGQKCLPCFRHCPKGLCIFSQGVSEVGMFMISAEQMREVSVKEVPSFPREMHTGAHGL